MDPSSAPWRVVDQTPGPIPPGNRDAPTPALGRATLLIGAAVIVLLAATAVAVASGALAGPLEPVDPLVVDASTRSTEASVVVDVGGAVLAPGVYHLPAGSRVGDAVAAAGGFGPRVDAARAAAELNLAAILEDGSHLLVPSRDDPAPGGPDAAGGGSDGTLVDLNTATQAELEALPGIGPVTALKILDALDEARFSAVEDLRTRKLVGEKTFEGLRDLVTVR